MGSRKIFYWLRQETFGQNFIVYPSIHKINKLNKKKKKLHLLAVKHFKRLRYLQNAITKILDEFKEWKAYSIGDEDRKRPVIYHKNHQELGFLEHKDVLKF